MEDNELQKLLEQLHGQMEHANAIDDKGRELLQDLDAHIHELLNRTQAEQEQDHPSTILRLQDAIAYLEVSHPLLTDTLTKFMNTLSGSGI